MDRGSMEAHGKSLAVSGHHVCAKPTLATDEYLGFTRLRNELWMKYGGTLNASFPLPSQRPKSQFLNLSCRRDVITVGINMTPTITGAKAAYTKDNT